MINKQIKTKKMKNSALMRPDLLLVTTQGVQGKKYHSNFQGQARLKVTKGFNEPQNTISIDTFEGMGHTYSKREKALINIEFEDGKIWSGTFDKLKTILIKQ